MPEDQGRYLARLLKPLSIYDTMGLALVSSLIYATPYRQ